MTRVNMRKCVIMTPPHPHPPQDWAVSRRVWLQTVSREYWGSFKSLTSGKCLCVCVCICDLPRTICTGDWCVCVCARLSQCQWSTPQDHSYNSRNASKLVSSHQTRSAAETEPHTSQENKGKIIINTSVTV